MVRFVTEAGHVRPDSGMASDSVMAGSTMLKPLMVYSAMVMLSTMAKTKPNSMSGVESIGGRCRPRNSRSFCSGTSRWLTLRGTASAGGISPEAGICPMEMCVEIKFENNAHKGPLLLFHQCRW